MRELAGSSVRQKKRCFPPSLVSFQSNPEDAGLEACWAMSYSLIPLLETGCRALAAEPQQGAPPHLSWGGTSPPPRLAFLPPDTGPWATSLGKTMSAACLPTGADSSFCSLTSAF